MRDIGSIRSDLPALASLTYLNSGTAGPLPRASVDAMVEVLGVDAVRGRISGRRFSKIAQTVDAACTALGDLVGAEPRNVVLTSGTTDGLARALASIEWSTGDRVITTAGEHPDVVELLDRLRRAHSIELVVVGESTEPLSSTDVLLDAVTAGARAVVLSHVSYATGEIMPIDAVVEQAHSVGAVVIVDGAQAVGALNVNVAALGVDFYAFSGHKWLLGPEGTGALVVGAGVGDTTARRRQRTVNVLVTGLVAALEWRVASGSNAELTDATYRRAERARRALTGVRSVSVVTPPEHAGLVAFRIDGVAADDIAIELGRSRIATRAVANGSLLRAAFGFFTTDEEIDSFVGAVGAIAAEQVLQ